MRTGWLLLVGIIVVGCVEAHELALDRASREFDCPRNKLRVKWLSSSQLGEIYRVDGCGVVVTYACDNFREECIKESDDRRSSD